ncbi:MAG: hypothetical protein IKT40_09330 [Bacilli bacterium]|nr:hypothetical protein [Bacilli bacterium]
MLRFIDDKTKNVIMDDGDLLLSDFKDSGITIIYDQKEYYFIECGNKIIIEVDNLNHQFLQEIITKNNILPKNGIYTIPAKYLDI